MPSRFPLLHLYDIRDNARLAYEWTAIHTRESFEADQQIFYAVTRCLEIISEASRRIPQEVRDRHPELPWQKIMAVGNVYRDDYDNVQYAFVWRTVQERLPALLAAIEDEIAFATSQGPLSNLQKPDGLPEREEPHPEAPNTSRERRHDGSTGSPPPSSRMRSHWITMRRCRKVERRRKMNHDDRKKTEGHQLKNSDFIKSNA